MSAEDNAVSEKTGWNEVEVSERMRAEGVTQVETAWKTERTRCLELVRTEIVEGKRRGIPDTSGTMLILYRLQSAIENG